MRRRTVVVRLLDGRLLVVDALCYNKVLVDRWDLSKDVLTCQPFYHSTAGIQVWWEGEKVPEKFLCGLAKINPRELRFVLSQFRPSYSLTVSQPQISAHCHYAYLRKPLPDAVRKKCTRSARRESAYGSDGLGSPSTSVHFRRSQ